MADNEPEKEIRLAVEADAAAVAAIWHDGWRDAHLGHVPETLSAARDRESFDRRAAQRVGDTTVAVVDGAVAGFVMVVGDEVEQVYVAGKHRGTGIAGELLAEAERLVAANGYRRAWLAVVAANVRACRFYAKHGWRDDGPFEYEASTDRGRIAVPAHRYVKDVGSRTSADCERGDVATGKIG